MNCDGAFRDHDMSGGWGFVIRDCAGTVIGSCLQAVQKAVELGIQKIVLATDAVEVVQILSKGCVDRSTASGLVWELKDLIHCNFVSNVAIHNPRSCNLVAHFLAAAGAGLSRGIGSIRDSIPNCIQVLVANDLASGSE